MPDRIRDLLHRRTDLSTFLVHLTKHYQGRQPCDNLLNILRLDRLVAKNAFGMGSTFACENSAFQDSQRVVCFTETPLEHVWMMCSEIEGRSPSLAPYGLAVTKVWGRRSGANPVWYIDITPGHDWLTQPIDRMRDRALADSREADGVPLHRSSISRLLPFFEQMGPTSYVDGMPQSRKEWWWEREWRHVGDLVVHWGDIVALFVPEVDHDTFRTAAMTSLAPGSTLQLPPLLDASWGLERMISSLRGFSAYEAGPFP